MKDASKNSSKTRFWVGCLVYHKSTGRYGVVVSCNHSICKIVYAVDGADDQTPITVVSVDLEHGFCCTKCQELKREHELAVKSASLCTGCEKGQQVVSDQSGPTKKARLAAPQRFDPVAPLIW